jgi:hypothetical protein
MLRRANLQRQCAPRWITETWKSATRSPTESESREATFFPDSLEFLNSWNSPNYSYLSASVGFNRAARFAGNIPNTTPTTSDTQNATTIDTGEIGTRI